MSCKNVVSCCAFIYPGPLFIKRTVLPQDLVKSRSHEIRVQAFPIALKFDRHINSSAVERLMKFHDDAISIISNLARFHGIWWDILPLSEYRPSYYLSHMVFRVPHYTRVMITAMSTMANRPFMYIILGTLCDTKGPLTNREKISHRCDHDTDNGLNVDMFWRCVARFWAFLN